MQCVDHDHEVYWKKSAADLTWFKLQTQKPFFSFTCNQIKLNQRELKSNQNFKHNNNNNNKKSQIKTTLTLSSSRAQISVLGFLWAKMVERRVRCWVMLLLQVTIAKGWFFERKKESGGIAGVSLLLLGLSRDLRIREYEIWGKGNFC